MASEHEQSGRRVQVCETGFGAGHSTALWLASHPLVDVLVFDNFDRAYQRECLEVLEASFPGRVTHVEGDTCKTVPGYQAAQGGFAGCDFVHAASLCEEDTANLVGLSGCGALVTGSGMHG
eukprot:773529-Rhodomonas_salina.1